MKKGLLYVNICIITVTGFFSILIRLFSTISGGALIIALVVLLYSLRNIFLTREHKINSKMIKVLYVMIVAVYASLIIVFYAHFTDKIELLDWSTLAAFALYFILIHTYYTFLFSAGTADKKTEE